MHTRVLPAVIISLLGLVCLSVEAQTNNSPVYVNNILPIMQGSGISAPKQSLVSNNDPKSAWSFLLSANLQSHANDSETVPETLIIDGEVHQLGFVSKWNFSPTLQLGVELSLIKNSSGNLDNLIREWHDLFGLDQGDRNDLPDDRFLFFYRGEDSFLSQRTINGDSVSSISDTEISLAYQLYQNDKFSIATYLSAMLPTGKADKLTGSDKADIKLTLALGSQNNSAFAWHLNADLIAIGDDSLFNIPTKSNTWSGSAGLHWRSSDNWRWSMQLDGHGEVFDSLIEEINKPAWQLTLASNYKQWQIYFAEDITVNRAADFSLGINWVSQY